MSTTVPGSNSLKSVTMSSQQLQKHFQQSNGRNSIANKCFVRLVFGLLEEPISAKSFLKKKKHVPKINSILKGFDCIYCTLTILTLGVDR